jgi:hypothetical protein
MAGLFPVICVLTAIHLFISQLSRKVVPIQIRRSNHSDFPRARPLPDIVFALDDQSNIIKLLKISGSADKCTQSATRWRGPASSNPLNQLGHD